jgi:seryl-tRNA synthetase
MIMTNKNSKKLDSQNINQLEIKRQNLDKSLELAISLIKNSGERIAKAKKKKESYAISNILTSIGEEPDPIAHRSRLPAIANAFSVPTGTGYPLEVVIPD